MASFSFMMKGSAPSILTSVSDHFFLEVHRNDLAILAARARTQSNDVALLRLLGDSVRDDGASGGVGFAVDAAQSHGARRCSIRRFHWPVRASLTDRTRVIDGIEQDAGEDIHVLTDCRDNEWPARPCHLGAARGRHRA